LIDAFAKKQEVFNSRMDERTPLRKIAVYSRQPSVMEIGVAIDKAIYYPHFQHYNDNFLLRKKVYY